MIWIIAITALLASLLTLFSGFGLGTLLTPVFGLFFPIHIAIALTGIVHLLNNLFKLTLLGKKADWSIVIRFGIPSVVGGLTGAWVLARLTNIPTLYSWNWGQRLCEITPLKLAIAGLMILFTLMELIPKLKKLQFAQQYMTLGGLVSGFFGGLSGHQGALRTAFLIKAGLEKQCFIATGVVIACLVDMTRLPVYFSRFESGALWREWLLLLVAIICAFSGAWLGAKYLQKVTYGFLQSVTGTLMVIFALLLGTGVI